MAPGVMGSTGIETYDIIESILSKIDVDYIVVVDALATNSIKRINKTIQLTNTGIKPGAGIGNRRKELSKKTLGIPVIAIGVPTVVDATTITVDAINMVLKQLYLENNNKTSLANMISTSIVKEDLDKVNNISNPEKSAFFGSFGLLSNDEQKTLIEEILTPQGYNLIVTPKEIDIDVEDLSKIIANGINMALHIGIYNRNNE
jgi:spore protease